ncbi:hypothetical protein ACX27_05030 [Nostoc piscinale CENA21]|uniref:Uncharacterized protein n=1 Tax=Nostoc piscinale CENA21 TaxID=224013 RepID=A0A0M5MG46_9NOSO|nr:hypothetical protein ACX27_05030 [Nostoc piscinale CENA21]
MKLKVERQKLMEAGVERQEAGGRLEEDLNPPLIVDRQITPLMAGDLNPNRRVKKALCLIQNFPFCLARRAVKRK